MSALLTSTALSSTSVSARTMRWAVAIKQPMRGALALLHTRRQGFPIFNPVFKDTKRNTNEDLFPGYFFVDMHGHSLGWRVLLSTIGVAGVVLGTGRAPGLVAHSVIQKIKDACTPDGIYITPPKPRFVRGQQVQVETTKGRHSFEGHLGIYEGDAPKDRCKVLFGLVPVLISESDLIAA